MTLSWNRASRRFASLSRRERALIASAALMSILAMGFVLLIEPALKHRDQRLQQIGRQQADGAALRKQMEALQARRHPDGGRPAQAEAGGRHSLGAPEELERLQPALMPPQQTGQLLASLLARHRGIQLVRLRSLPAMALTGLPQRGADKTAVAAEPALAGLQAAAAPGSSGAAAASRDESPLYRHGIEITVQGSHADVLAYLATLEAMPRRLYWGELKIDTEAGPAVLMTFTIYTFSLEKSWWTL